MKLFALQVPRELCKACAAAASCSDGCLTHLRQDPALGQHRQRRRHKLTIWFKLRCKKPSFMALPSKPPENRRH
jgi:hypothetical protein